MTNKDGDNKQQDIENRIFDCLKSDDQDKNQPGLLPPQALLSTPPPSLDSTEDTSTLLSPWWSEEPPVESNEESVYTTENVTSNYEFIPTIETAEEEQPITSLTTSDTTTTTTPSIIEKDMIDKEDKDNVLNISVLSFGRSSPKDSPIQWKERCILLATTANEIPKSTENSKDVQKELANIFDSSKECSMICFLKTSQRFIKDEKKNQTLFQRLVPFYGRWISVAKTPTRCKEHLLNPGDMTKKSFTDYYTMEIGEELSHSGEYGKKKNIVIG